MHRTPTPPVVPSANRVEDSIVDQGSQRQVHYVSIANRRLQLVSSERPAGNFRTPSSPGRRSEAEGRESTLEGENR